ncbi:MAG: hypothetical protein L3K23_02060 [Thermoplasmata archaeon]|nr:hypothetical protein [Thermoplasmata archaeon]
MRRPAAVTLATVLLLGGLTLAIGNGSTPGYHVSSLATSGSFFALASSGDTLYAASDNGGSILLETSHDRGVDWAASPVPYSAVAGGAPWEYAAVAVDANALILTAATGGTLSVYTGYPPYVPGPQFVAQAGQCGTNSTILVASSVDGGLTWNTTTFPTGNLSVSSLQAGIEGSAAAVAWLGTTTDCSSQVGRVGALSSRDGGGSWPYLQELAGPNDSVTTGSGLEMAPEENGLLVGFPMSSATSGTRMLGLWELSNRGPGGFSAVTEIPAPSSWTLQGDPGRPAYLLTPTYLIPLTSPPYTAIPFDQLQTDGGGIGVLPRVVGLVARGPGDVEIAATTSDNLGVDCWQFDVAHGRVSQSCHVPVGSALLPSGPALPIVALIDGGGWWAAIGAAGGGCYPGCGSYGGLPPGAPTAGSASVGTSVCFTGCSSAEGLAAYSYTQGASLGTAALNSVAAIITGIGGLVLIATVVSFPRRGTPNVNPERRAPEAGEPRSENGESLRTVRLAYLASLGAWAAVWIPLAVLAFLPDQRPVPSGVELAVLFGGIGGPLITFPIHHILRARLQRMHGVSEDQLFGGMASGPVGREFEQIRTASYFAYASWAAGVAVVVALGTALWSGSAAGVSPPNGPVVSGPSPAAVGVVVAVVLFGILRTLYHLGLEQSVSATATPPADAEVVLRRNASDRRARLGAALLPWNPLTGLIVGAAMAPTTSWSPFFLAWVFLPITLLGIALLSGCFGSSTWSSSALSPESSSIVPG